MDQIVEQGIAARDAADDGLGHQEASGGVSMRQGGLCLVMDTSGQVNASRPGVDGLYCRDTRHLSHLAVRLRGRPPIRFGSSYGPEDASYVVDVSDAAGRDGEPDESLNHSHGNLHLRWTAALGDGVAWFLATVTNSSTGAVSTTLQVWYGADFRDIFEVRGMRRPKRGRDLPPRIATDKACLSHAGLDSAVRTTEVCFSPLPAAIGPGLATYRLDLAPHGTATVRVMVACAEGAAGASSSLVHSLIRARRQRRAGLAGAATISSPHIRTDALFRRVRTDLSTLVSMRPTGPYPDAGIPWFATEFGRDGLVTALLRMVQHPGLAEGVLTLLAETQCKVRDPASFGQPGKIMHERRRGEMAATGEALAVSYCTNDATPLFGMVVGALVRRTGMTAAIEALWPALDASLRWIEADGDMDGDFFVEYDSAGPSGPSSQSWKDSPDAISHADGRLATGLVACSEIQGYAYAAFLAGAEVAAAAGLPRRSSELSHAAKRLRSRFQNAFWSETLGTYALALDGDKRPCEVLSSNPGHLLLSGIVPDHLAARVVERLTCSRMSGGWGIRTLAEGEVRYNPMGYHTGSVWPHDNAIAAMGMARYGFRRKAVRIYEAMSDAALADPRQRLPELFCGFRRRPGQPPVPYPAACSPQAWSSASLEAALLACLGADADATRGMVVFDGLELPPSLSEVSVSGIPMGTGAVSATIRRVDGTTVVWHRRDG